MTKFPVPVHERFAATVKAHATAVKLHTQKITTLESRAAALAVQNAALTAQVTAAEPGAWQAITLTGGWSNVAGAIPAQARLEGGSVHLIGNIQGGTTSNGTVIGTLPAGYYNPAASHTFAAVAVTGAGAVGITVTLPTDQIPLTDHIANVTGSGTGHVTLGPSGTQFQNLPNSATGSGSVSYNTPLITLGTDGTLAIRNLHSSVTAVSWHEAGLPLV